MASLAGRQAADSVMAKVSSSRVVVLWTFFLAACGADETKQPVKQITLGVDVPSIEDLLSLDEPCLVRGLDDDLLRQMIDDWRPASLLSSALRQAELQARTIHAPSTNARDLSSSQTRASSDSVVMRYRHASSWFDQWLGLTWPRHVYDAWEMEASTFDRVLNPPAGVYKSFSLGAEQLQQILPDAVRRVGQFVASVCPFGCPQSLYIQKQLWIASPSTGQHMHFDAFTNVFLHLSGQKTIILAPPEAVLEHGHLFPDIHPASRQTQLLWSNSTSDRVAVGFSVAQSSGGQGLKPTYRHDLEKRVELQEGDVLLVPLGWGHQTFTGQHAPSVSVAAWFFSASTDPRSLASPAAELRDSLKGKALDSVVRDLPASVRTAGFGKQWSYLRDLGVKLVNELIGPDVTSFFNHWEQQRWVPQLIGFGKAVETLSPTWLCLPVRAKAKSVKKLSDHCRQVSELYQPGMRNLMLRYEVANILDRLVPALGPAQPDVKQFFAKHATSSPEEVVALLVHSFAGCPQAPSKSKGEL